MLIGRNEGERLRRSLASVVGRGMPVVYVDSGSTDGSVEHARSVGADVIELPRGVPFTAARARNAGLERLVQANPQVGYVQFADGDCRIAEGWIDAAAAALDADAGLVAVCGRRREAHPEASVYNLMCDLEWDTPVGEARSCGGDAMMRVAALRAVGGFNPEVIAGEEPELCVRLRAAGGRIARLDREMTLHDAAMTSFGQWWKRTKRAGHAYAEGAARHGAPPERHCVRDVRSIVVWGGVLPVLAVAAAWWTWGLSVVALAALYAVQAVRVAVRQQRKRREGAWAYGVFTVLGKVPQMLGVMTYHANRARGKRAAIIEYKGAAA